MNPVWQWRQQLKQRLYNIVQLELNQKVVRKLMLISTMHLQC